MRTTPAAVRFTQLQALLKYEGCQIIDKRGSHFKLVRYQSDIDDIAFSLYGIDGEDRRMREAGASGGFAGLGRG